MGALLAGALADTLGLSWAIGTVAGLTLPSGIMVALVMYENLPARRALQQDA